MNLRNIIIFPSNYWLNLIIALFVLLFFLIICRYFYLRKILCDKVQKMQTPELRDNFVLTRDKYQLQIFKHFCDNSDIIVIGVHGLQGQKEDFKLIKNYCYQKNWSFLAFDRRGAGKNFADHVFRTFATDINDTKDVVWAVKSKYPKHRIVLFGEAVGASIAVLSAKNNGNISGVITSNLITKHQLVAFSFSLLWKFIFGFF